MGPGKDKLDALEKKMGRLGITKQDIDEKFIKSPGRGGQKVNKRNSAVYLLHRKTGLSVKCHTSRSQHLNRFLALRLLVDKIEQHMAGGQAASLCKADRIRKQKAARKRKTKKKLKAASEPVQADPET